MAQLVEITSPLSQNRSLEVFNLQRKASRREPYPCLAKRLENLKKLEMLLVDNQQAIADAICKDFGNRCRQETQLAELFTSIDGLRYCQKNLKKWMKPSHRSVSIWFAGARNKVLPQPKGVVGIIAPWNYPLFLTFGPLASAMAAGNRCMIKMAANSLNLATLMAQLVAQQFDEDTLAILPGVAASEFSSLSYDHLIFTGSPSVGKTIMKTAAENLTPVTLELGGKSPAIIASDYNIKTAAERILQGKLINAGQTCVAPDYVFLPKDKLEVFIEHAKSIVANRYTCIENKSYTSIIDKRAYARLTNTLKDAEGKGAKLVNLLDGVACDEALNKISPHLVLNTNEQMLIMQDEIFGPLLPIKLYTELDEVLEHINLNERPLALYLFSNSKKIQNHVIKHTLSGGVCLNECVFHVAQHDLPFGGIGNSGMGHYHGVEGFNEFSKLRPIFTQSLIAGTAFLAPPYGKVFDTLYRLMVGKGIS